MHGSNDRLALNVWPIALFQFMLIDPTKQHSSKLFTYCFSKAITNIYTTAATQSNMTWLKSVTIYQLWNTHRIVRDVWDLYHRLSPLIVRCWQMPSPWRLHSTKVSSAGTVPEARCPAWAKLPGVERLLWCTTCRRPIRLHLRSGRRPRNVSGPAVPSAVQSFTARVSVGDTWSPDWPGPPRVGRGGEVKLSGRDGQQATH